MSTIIKCFSRPTTGTIGNAVIPAFCLKKRFSILTDKSERFDRGKIEENIRVADEIKAYVLDKIKGVSTWGIEPPVTLEKFAKLNQLGENLCKTRDLAEEILSRQPDEKRNVFVLAAIRADLARERGLGNCGEMTCLGLMRLTELGWPGRAGSFVIIRPEEAPMPEEIFRTTDNGHSFLVVGLGNNSKTEENDERSLGPNAVICDPYSKKESYPISEMNDRLHNYYGLDETTRPILAKIDPRFDKINLVCSNIFSSNEFVSPFLVYKNFFKNAIPLATEISHRLDSFNSATSREEKMANLYKIMKQVPPLLYSVRDMETKLHPHIQERIAALKESQENSEPGNNEQVLTRVLEEAHAITSEIAKVLYDCEGQIFTLCSQLKRFKDPKSPPFS